MRGQNRQLVEGVIRDRDGGNRREDRRVLVADVESVRLQPESLHNSSTWRRPHWNISNLFNAVDWCNENWNISDWNNTNWNFSDWNNTNWNISDRNNASFGWDIANWNISHWNFSDWNNIDWNLTDWEKENLSFSNRFGRNDTNNLYWRNGNFYSHWSNSTKSNFHCKQLWNMMQSSRQG